MLHPCHTVAKSCVTHVSCALAGYCCIYYLSLVDHPIAAYPPLLSQAPYIADSMLQMYHQSLCLLPSIVNPKIALRVLDSTGRVTVGP